MSKLLKIGTLGLPENRWVDAKEKFEKIYVVCEENEKKLDSNLFEYITYKFSGLSMILKRIVMHTNKHKGLDWLSELLIVLLRITKWKTNKYIKDLQCNEIHSSYNDFDHSAFMTLVINPKEYTRAQKETRPEHSFFEKKTFIKATRIVLNDECNAEFYKKKYGDIFKKKTMLFHLDEDVRKEGINELIKYRAKLSETTNKIHAVILAGRVMSSPKDARSGGRLYYIPLIEELLSNGFVVHLHTGSIETDQGRNPYEELEKMNNNFVIEKRLDFINNPLEAYGILSMYDIGILHAHIPDCEVTLFDKVNLPHRYYEYELAHVVPIDEHGKNVLIEKKTNEGYAITYEKLSDITIETIKKVKWDIPTFKEYIEALY